MSYGEKSYQSHLEEETKRWEEFYRQEEAKKYREPSPSEIHNIAAGERAAIVKLIRERANELNYYDGAYILDETADRIEEGEHHEGPKEA